MEKIEIRIRKQINFDWSNWLNGLSVTQTNDGETILSGCIRDQSALRGLINMIADLNLPLSSIESKKIKTSTESEMRR
ncbi:MAG TPA: hypothetical protein G4O15_05990 [Dehalococcoidia bacterium]|nr:hypothetical protein [Dehalococcoidia bacterium]